MDWTGRPTSARVGCPIMRGRRRTWLHAGHRRMPVEATGRGLSVSLTTGVTGQRGILERLLFGDTLSRASRRWRGRGKWTAGRPMARSPSLTSAQHASYAARRARPEWSPSRNAPCLRASSRMKAKTNPHGHQSEFHTHACRESPPAITAIRATSYGNGVSLLSTWLVAEKKGEPAPVAHRLSRWSSRQGWLLPQSTRSLPLRSARMPIGMRSAR